MAMTGEAGANRTFRSIFSDKMKQHDELLKLEQERGALVAANSDAVLVMDDDDDTLWNEEPLLDGSATAITNSDKLERQFAQLKSMEEWADDDDEEDNWKDALQDRVNQLEVALQHRSDTAMTDSRSHCFDRLPEKTHHRKVHEAQGVDFSQSLPVSIHITSLGVDEKRSRLATRHKMQRTSSLHACITGDRALASGPNHTMWSSKRHGVEGKGVKLSNRDIRIRATSTDFVARNIETGEHLRKRLDSLSGSSASKTNSPRLSLGRKKIIDSKHTSPSLRKSSRLCGNKEAAYTSSGVAVAPLSETEAIRRYVLNDVKNMSMERLVSDVQRLHFLESYYQNRQPSEALLSATTSTNVAPTSPASSFSPMSTS